MIRLPEIGDEEQQDVWQLSMRYAENYSASQLRGRSRDEAVEHTFRGLIAERCYFRYVGKAAYDACVELQNRDHSRYGPDGLDSDVKSVAAKFGLNFKYRLLVRPDTLERAAESKRYVLVLVADGECYYAGWSTREELQATPIWRWGKHAMRMGEGLHTPDEDA